MARLPAPTCVLIMIVAGALATPGVEAARAAGSWTWPVQGEVITPFRNGEDPYAGGQHRGIDVAAGSGTAVIAAAAGTVRFAGVAGSSGLTVSVLTSDGRFDTSYLHLSAIEVGEGDSVGAGARIGAVGTSGRRSATAEHLHFGIREAGTRHAYRDPLDFLAPPPAPTLRDAPRGPPVPVVPPVRIAPFPEPVRRPVRARRPVPLRPRVRVPAGWRVRAPGARRLPHGVARRPGPAPVRHGFRVRAPAPVRHGFRVRAPAPVSTPRHSPSAGPAPALAPLSRTSAQPLPAGRPSPAAESGGGPDLGWALACAGLLLAAACLGSPDDRRGKVERVRPALRALLRPLTGGR